MKELRLKKGFTQLEMGKKLGMDVRQYRRYENSEQTPSVSVALDIASHLGSNVEDIWGTKKRGIKMEGKKMRWEFIGEEISQGRNIAELEEGQFVADYIEYRVGQEIGCAVGEEGSITFYLEDEEVERLEKHKEEITAGDIFQSAWESYDSRDWKIELQEITENLFVSQCGNWEVEKIANDVYVYCHENHDNEAIDINVVDVLEEVQRLYDSLTS